METDCAVHIVTAHDDVESPVVLNLSSEAVCPGQSLSETFGYIGSLKKGPHVNMIHEALEAGAVGERR